MKTSRCVRLSLFVLVFSMIATCVFAQEAAKTEFQPVVGQAGKDVIWVPTCQEMVNKMLDMAKVTPSDFVVDLGSGDGRTVITAAKRGARALGIEYNANMVALSKRNAEKEGLGDRTQFINADLFQTDFSQATVVTMFLLPDINTRLRPQILDMKPGTRIVSNTFTMGEWTADETATVEGSDCSIYNTPLLWIVPAKVQGTWKSSEGQLTLKQSFQMVSGTLNSGTNIGPVTNGKLSGEIINFSVGNVNYTGRVSGETMQGTLDAAGKAGTWSAIRIGQ
jgi:hypothetical protein